MHAVYGDPPADLAPTVAGAIQVSPLSPGARALEEVADGSLDGIVMHAPRGTLDRRYVMAHSLRSLRVGATFTMLALKKQGGNRLGDELTGFGCSIESDSKRHFRICSGRRPEQVDVQDAIAGGAPRFVEEISLWTQPGIFSWDRIDPGSTLLIDEIASIPLAGRGADLGCGIGVLARTVLVKQAVEHVTAIDIDRRAIEATRRNVGGARCTPVWADVRRPDTVPGGLDFVVMNPPFHDGGTEDQDLGRAFIANAAQALRPGGICLLVSNRHLPYEAALRTHFTSVTSLTQDDGFKVHSAIK